MCRLLNGRARCAAWSALLVVSIFFGPLASLQAAYPPPGSDRLAQAGRVASLDPVQGLIQHLALEAPQKNWQTVTGRQLVGEGDWIRTDGQGWAFLTFFEGTATEILPDTLVQVSRLVVAEDGPSAVTLNVLVGDTLHRVSKLADTRSRYEVHTSSAVIAVRGTEFWVSAALSGATRVSAVDGQVQVQGITPDGHPGKEVTVEAGQTVEVAPDGVPGPVEPVQQVPARPSGGALAPVTCGDGTCAAGENATCPADCAALPDCGDGACDLAAGEGPLTCPQDCIPRWGEPTSLTFHWGIMACVFRPYALVTDSLSADWGIGCFDTAASASAHPHPAGYQLIVDGQAWDMGGLQQSGPHVHVPFCPWGWNYQIGPLELTPGIHILTLIESLTDTWHDESGGGRAGEVNSMTCPVVVLGP